MNKKKMTANEQSHTIPGEMNEQQQQTDTNVSIRQMFDCNRIETYKDIFFLCLYFPIGICLLTVRLFIFVHVLLISSVLPKDSYIRILVFRTIFCVLGVVIQEEDLQLKHFKAQQIISNRISDFDPLVINLIYPCQFLSTSTFPQYITWLFGIPNEVVAQNTNDLSKVIPNNSMPVVCFPECSRTNGRVGLFKFESWPFSSGLASHLIFIESKNPLFNITLSPLGASWIANLLWLLFTPFTFFNIRYLSAVERGENESAEEFAKRAQIKMASQTKLYASNFDKNDKKEMMKRIRAEQMAKIEAQKRKNETRQKQSFSLSIDEMAGKVKEVLPQVPLVAIKSDIAVTNNIDDTIERILNGTVQYAPEVLPPKDSSSKASISASATSSSVSSESGKLFYCGASTFGKSASDRAKSFQERKEHLFRVARMRYIQKHNLTNK